jgi:hypothetical protein
MFDPFSPSAPPIWPRVALALVRARGDLMGAAHLAVDDYGATSAPATILKAAVTAGTTTDADWAGALASIATQATAQLVELARSRSAFEQMLPQMARVAFNTPAAAEHEAPAISWVGEAQPKPLSSGVLATLPALRPLKLVGMTAHTVEVQRAAPGAEAAMVRMLRNALARMQDAAFFSDAAAVSGVSAGGIFAGVSPIVSSGDASGDLGALAADFGGDFSTAAWVMGPSNAAQLGLRGGQFVDVGARGGTLGGVPVYVTSAIESDTSGGSIALLDLARIVVAAGDVIVDATSQAAMQFDDAPTSPATGSTVLISLWQHNMIGLKVERHLNWQRADDTAVSLVTGASYGGS